VASLSQGRTAAAQCGLFTYKSVPVIFEPPCTYVIRANKMHTFYISDLIKYIVFDIFRTSSSWGWTLGCSKHVEDNKIN